MPLKRAPASEESVSFRFSDVLHADTLRLRRQEADEAWAARLIQKRWRAHAEGRRTCMRKQRTGQVQSKIVQAPAYFGDSCLWAPIEDWESGPQLHYKYSARCETN